jgi:uncharacterized protein YabN with tetrapyrrole methylase and pyrophosphatase domain
VSEELSGKPKDTKKGSLTIVGSGLQAVRQFTLEARQSIEQADKVLYLISDPICEMWIKKLHPDAESLRVFYGHDKHRAESYKQMTELTLRYVREGLNVCEVCTGHPGVFVDHTHESIRQARSEDFEARMLPGISAEDCLFADLNIDPSFGCQSFEATGFLIRKPKLDTSCHVILWQIGIIGDPGFHPGRDPKPTLEILVDYLKQHYDSDQLVFVYEAAEYAIGKPIILSLPLSKLPDTYVSYRSTLYIPPKANPAVDHRMVEKLGLSSEFKVADVHFSVKKLFRLGRE